MNLQSYLNGSSHLVNRLTSFSRAVSRGQLDFGAWFTVKAKPSVAAKGLLAALRWDEAATLSRLTVPTRVITADADRITLPGAAKHMHRTVPTSDLVRIAPAGHTGLLEEGRAYSEAIAAGIDPLHGRERSAPVPNAVTDPPPSRS
jgi:pimeloyl-ACP methyl ester carboxylesterase